MIVSFLHRFIFVAVPKTGTDSVRQALRPHLGPEDMEQARLLVEKQFPMLWSADGTVFSFMRIDFFLDFTDCCGMDVLRLRYFLLLLLLHLLLFFSLETFTTTIALHKDKIQNAAIL